MFTNCVIHIPVGSMFAYLNSDWSEFINIIEDESINSLHSIDYPSSEAAGIYDLTGRPVANPILGHIYILRSTDGIAKKTIYQ